MAAVEISAFLLAVARALLASAGLAFAIYVTALAFLVVLPRWIR